MSVDKPESTTERPFELERIVFFSDAVFAIAITLLAIELKAPDIGAIQTDARLFAAIADNWSHFFSFTLSFWIIAVFWLAHHRYFRYIKRYDAALIWRNFLFLFFIALMPFTTSVLGEYGNLSGAVWLYAVNMMGLGLASAWMWAHATRKHALVDPDLDAGFIQFIQMRAFATPLVSVLVILATFVVGPSASMGWLLIWVVQILIGRYVKGHE